MNAEKTYFTPQFSKKAGSTWWHMVKDAETSLVPLFNTPAEANAWAEKKAEFIKEAGIPVVEIRVIPATEESLRQKQIKFEITGGNQ